VGFNERLYVFHQGFADSGELCYTSSVDGETWANDQQVPDLGMSASPSAVLVD
ncbi:MAG: hypothetical protein JOY55_18020, partial [Mycobacterium sp.]|nr:hypothetical protein [Mycobacterium sp.]